MKNILAFIANSDPQSYWHKPILEALPVFEPVLAIG